MDFKNTGSLKCGACSNNKVYIGTAKLLQHYRLSHGHLEKYVCGHCCKSVLNLTTLIRHITSYHIDIFQGGSFEDGDLDDNVGAAGIGNIEPNVDLVGVIQPYGDAAVIGIADPNINLDIVDIGENVAREDEEVPSMQEVLEKAAAQTLMELRSTSSLTGMAIQRFEKASFGMVQQLCSSIKKTVSCKLVEKGLSPVDVQEILSDLDSLEDPFKNLKTIDDQLNYFHEKYGLVKPSEKLLDTRIDRRLDPSTNCQVQVQVKETFQYISVIETLTAVLRNKKIRDLILNHEVSSDGVLRSYADGTTSRENEFVRKHEDVVQLLLYYDELEIANALGSKTIINKLATFFLQILNLPPEESSKLSSIYLLALAHADDLKKPGAFRKVLTLFVLEMKRLTSDEGVEITIDEQRFILLAILGGVAADTPAAHDLIGLLGVGAKFFCRRCLVSKGEVRADANMVGPLRNSEQHQLHIEEVQRRPKFSSQCGVKRSCPLSEIPHFDCTSAFIFDAFHDILEGTVPFVLKLVIRHYIYVNKYFSLSDLNLRVSSFNYGIPDIKNKPSANFSEDMLCKPKGKLKQSGSQMWCLMRSLPLILGELIPADNELMHLVFLQQNIMRIVFSFEVKADDTAVLDALIEEHNALFLRLFVTVPEQDIFAEVDEEAEVGGMDDEGVDDEAVDEEAVDDPEVQVREEDNEDTGNEGRGRRKKKKMSKVHVINRLHHLKHYREYMERYGPLVRLWCAKFEGRMKIFRQHASICCNFKNPPKTMAKMFHLSTLQSLVDDSTEKSIDFHKGRQVEVQKSEHKDLLINEGLLGTAEVTYTNCATLRGEEYRPGLFVCVPNGNAVEEPTFALITHVIVAEQTVSLVLKSWDNDGLSRKYNAYSVSPTDNPASLLVNVTSLRHHNCIAPWTTTENDTIYLSMRTIPL